MATCSIGEQEGVDNSHRGLTQYDSPRYNHSTGDVPVTRSADVAQR